MSLTPSTRGLKIVLFLLCFFVLGGVLYFKSHGVREPIVLGPQKTNTSEIIVVPDGQMEDGVIEDTSSTTSEIIKGSYEGYLESKIGNVPEGTKVILFWNASWSQSSQKTDKELQSIKIPDNLLVLSVDYDSFVTLRKEYEVTEPNTFIEVDAEGKVLERWNNKSVEEVFKLIK